MSTVFVLLVAVWISLTQSFTAVGISVGVIGAAGITLLQHHLFPSIHVPSLGMILSRAHLVLLFVVVLLWRFVSSTLYTCWLILTGREEGRIVALPVRIEDPIGKFVLLNSITFTPSTISLLLEDDVLYVHWLRAHGHKGDWRAIKESLERRLLPIFCGGKNVDR
ncbi:Na+/H+ antiporter subunit E [Candidatus Bipolaricaulota bacterium]|nr:Na+/H+ antiporter subunit E [Candidatus Bipolaricaulota bacterium]